MALKIRLRKQGRRNRPFYRVVVVDSRAKRDGKYLEALGWYDPFQENEKGLALSSDRLVFWLERGAQMTESIEALVSRGAPDVWKREQEKKVQRRLKAAKKRKETKRKAKVREPKQQVATA